MNRIQFILHRNWLLLGLYMLVLLAGMTLCMLYDKLDIALVVNRWNTPFLDRFFSFVTYAGTFGFIGPVLLILLFVRYRYALVAAVSSLGGFILVQFAKRVIWYDAPRPKVLFKDLPGIHYVEGVHLHSSHSFPSGHTQGAFALFMVLALLSRNRTWQLVCLLLALLTAYSRMYLSQHFLVDVLAGSALGTFSALMSQWYFSKEQFGRGSKLDGSLRSLFVRKS